MNGFKAWFFANIFPLVPKRLLSRATGVAMRVPLPAPVAKALIPAFARAFQIQADEAEHPAQSYRSLDAFFTRKLKSGARPIEADHIHPVDGRLTERGQIKNGQLVQAKNWSYDLGEFLGDPDGAAKYVDGSFYTYYLCPADYHRIHAPVGGDLVSAVHIPGLLWPVNEWSVNNIQRLFNLNERVVLNFKNPRGQWSMVLVGATNVGHITIALDEKITTKQWRWGRASHQIYNPPIAIKTGDEVGTFHLGSTVICVFDRNFAPTKHAGGAVRFGETFHPVL